MQNRLEKCTFFSSRNTTTFKVKRETLFYFFVIKIDIPAKFMRLRLKMTSKLCLKVASENRTSFFFIVEKTQDTFFGVDGRAVKNVL